MDAPKIISRIAKILGRAMLGLLFLLIAAVVIIHLPPVQEEITRKLANYLSSKIQARVSIQRATFSVLGNVTIEGLTLWDPRQNKIFSARKIEASSDIFDLIAGELTFDDIHLAGIEGKLIQSKEGLNVQFIIDAFKPKTRRAARKPAPVNLKFKRILLENIVFEFTSSVKGITVTTVLGTFASQKAELSTNPTRIKADQITLNHTVVNLLSTQQPDKAGSSVISEKKKPISPDFGTRIAFEIKDLKLMDNDVSFHRDQIMNARKFDPAHLDLKNIEIHLSNILMRDDTLSAALQSFSTTLPGFTLSRGSAGLHMNRKQLFLSGLYLASGSSELHADLSAPYDLQSTEDTLRAHIEMAISCQFTPGDFGYFVRDSLMQYFKEWGSTSVAFEGNYDMGIGTIKELNLATPKSHLHAAGLVRDVLDSDRLSWQNVMIDVTVGSDVKSSLTPFLKKINLPSDIVVELKTTGNRKKVFADARIFAKSGNLRSVGTVTRRRKLTELDASVIGDKVDLGEWFTQPSFGRIHFSAHAKGTIGKGQHMDVSGLIDQAEILNQPIRSVSFQSTTKETSAAILISIGDSNYRSEVASEISFAGPLIVNSTVQCNDFHLGRFLRNDSTLKISGNMKYRLKVDQSLLESHIEGRRFSFESHRINYSVDTMSVHALISPTRSDFTYFTEHAKADLTANFDIRDIPKVIRQWSDRALEGHGISIRPSTSRTARLSMELEDASFFKLVGIDVDDFSSFQISGELNEQQESAILQGTIGNFKGFGIALDTLYTDLKLVHDNVINRTKVNGLSYKSVRVDTIDFDLFTKGDSVTANLHLANDTLTLLDLSANILSSDSGRLVYPSHVRAFNTDYLIDRQNPVYIGKKGITFHDFRISRDKMEIYLNGDLNRGNVSLKNVDLAPLSIVLSRDTTVINKGHLTSGIFYSRENRQLDLNVNIDSLSLYNSKPLTISATALRHGNEVPFEFLLTNQTNKIDLVGRFFPEDKEIEASLMVDINDPEIFQFLTSKIFSEMTGSVRGRTTITGPIQNPALKGSLRFSDMELTTTNPRIAINVADDSILLENTAVHFKDFTIYDGERHPLNVTGVMRLPDYQSVEYDLQIDSDEFNLISNPDSTTGRVRGLLQIGSDIKLKGTGKNTNIEAKLAVKDATDLTFVTSADDIELITGEGIIDFIDPADLSDSVESGSDNYYDSLIASLPEFNLHSTVTIEEEAAFRVIVNEQSGDYIEASGRADLDVEYDRTGKLDLSGSYTIRKGVYRLSFYDLVKKNFELVPGSSINWSGSPKNGSLNIKARHTVQSNSIGLIGHEIGENEKSIYKRSLDYEVGINISGTVERPVISFLLDLPQDDKVSYPVLANKLDRMRQPEYQSELNKQVFGLLVLGGFLPDAGSANVNSNLVATTALSNSVNALLASQLNRFASQHIKGVSIDVGIQSYSDYSAPGGKTQTAMDFRVTKSLMNDRLSFEIGGDFDINQDQSGARTGDNYRGDIAIIYNLTGNGDKKLKLFNNETYDIVYQEIRNTGVSLIFVRESDRKRKKKHPTTVASKTK